MPDTKQARSITAARRKAREAARPRGVERQTEAVENVADPAPPADPEEDAVTYASWESFPASDAPGWR